jgi:3-hydroxyacyl-[acyl-carrier-protein] dehydratase
VNPLFAAPLRAVDEIQVTEDDGVLVINASKKILATDPYMAAHFPGRTIYPGIFILETVRQAVAGALGERSGALADLTAVCSLRFVGAVHPGEQLVVVATLRAPGPDGRMSVDADCRRGDGSAVARLVLEFDYMAGSDD